MTIALADPGGAATLAADALIIGSGTGGAAVADTLTRAGLDVMMVEEGPLVSAADSPGTGTAAFAQAWRGGGLTAAFGRPPIAYAEGRCVGGSTEISSSIFQTAEPDLLEFWARLYSIEDFGPGQLAPFYARAHASLNASLTLPPAGRPTELLADGGKKLGWSVTPLERAQSSCVGTNMCAFVCPTGGKGSMTNTLLPRAVKLGLRLYAGICAERIEVRGGAATAVHATIRTAAGGRRPVTLSAPLIFLCAGAVQSAALLRRSGLRHRIGDTLRLHPTLKCIALFDDEVDAHLFRLPTVAVTEFMPSMRIGGSVFTPALFAMSLAEDWERRGPLMRDWRRAASYYAMIAPIGCGRVRSVPFAREPFVTFKLAPEDWYALGVASARLAEVMFAAGARKVIPSITGHLGWQNADEAQEFVASPLPKSLTNLMTIHLFGSCPPGEDSGACATDSWGRVRGIDNLIVADASQIPEAPGVNPQATIMALSFRAAEAALGTSSASRRRAAAREFA